MSIRASIVMMIVALGCAFPTFAQNEASTVTILCYHVVESPSDSFYTISQAMFQSQMEYLAEAGYTVIPLARLHDYLAGRIESLPPDSVVITVDDGWRCTYTVIYPELRKRGFPFTAFLYPKFVNGGKYALDWDEVREMAEAGVDIQSHTQSHAFLTHRRHPSMSRADYIAWLRRELRESRETIEHEVGTEVTYLAYPYGDYDETVRYWAEQEGYQAAVTTRYGAVTHDAGAFELRRVSIDGTTTLSKFREYLGARHLGLTGRAPAAGGHLDRNEPVVAARIGSPDRIDPDSVRMSVLGLGPRPTYYNPDTGEISLVLSDSLEPGSREVVVWARDRSTGGRLEAVWRFRVDAEMTAGNGLPAPVTPPATGLR